MPKIEEERYELIVYPNGNIVVEGKLNKENERLENIYRNLAIDFIREHKGGRLEIKVELPMERGKK